MAFTAKLKGRYEAREVLGEGGMGVVYRAVDLEVPREVAVKTIREYHDPQELELFRRECGVLAMLHHPNIVDLYDYGDYEEGGHTKPFFVMPLLPGLTLDKLIRSSATRLTVQRVIDIITQTCRGLQAAHERGLVHRDIKPSNIFVLDDDSVKLIDFGVVHVADNRSRSGIKGTLPYMSPEQVEMGQPTTLSDIFSLAVVCYEALTRRRPFTGASDEELIKSILRHTPPPASDLNPAVTLGLAQVVHAAMAKKPWNRTSSARQFADELQKAMHGQSIERFDTTRIEPRIRRAQKALEESEYEFAGEILAELEAEGHVHPEIRSLRRQNDKALHAKTIAKLLDSARLRFQQEEYPLALQKVEEVLRLDPSNPDASRLKAEIESKHKSEQIDNWLRLVEEHIKNFAYDHARQAIQNVLALKPANAAALQLRTEVDRREEEYLQERREKAELYEVALDCWRRGEVSSALTKLERVLVLDRRAPDKTSSDSTAPYQNLYNQVRSEHDGIKNSYGEAQKLLSEGNFSGAGAICEEYLGKYPGHALFQALKFDIGERQRQHLSAYVAKVDRDVDAEPDLDRKVAILTEAMTQYPGEAHFQRALKVVTDRRDLVASIAQKAHNLEERGQFSEAIGQLEILRTVYPQYPGLEFEFERVARRRDQQAVSDAKSRWVDQVDRALSAGNTAYALKLLDSALAEFPDDAELKDQEKVARESHQRVTQAMLKLQEGQEFITKGEVEPGLDCLWQAHRLDEQNPAIRAVLVEALLKRASAEMERDRAVADQLIRQAMALDPGNTAARSLQKMAADRQREVVIDECLAVSRKLLAGGDPQGALTEVDKVLALYPDEPRLRARRDAILQNEGVHRTNEKREDLEEIQKLRGRLDSSADEAARASIVEQTRAIARKHPDDGQVQSAMKEVEQWGATVLLRGDRSASSYAPSPAPPAPTTQTNQTQTTETTRSASTAVQPAPVAAPVQPGVEAEEPVAKRKSSKRVLVAVLSIVLLAAITGVLVMSWPARTADAALRIEANVEEASVLVLTPTGTEPIAQASIRDGVAVFADLIAGTYRVQIRANGFRADERQITLDESQEGSLAFSLEPAVLNSVLAIQGGTPGADVFLDGVRIGTLDGSGEFSATAPDGLHVVELRLNDHEPFQIEQEFRPNETASIPASRLTPFGWIDFNVTPGQAVISYQASGDPQQHPAPNGERVSLKAGAYSVTARVGDALSRTENVVIVPGRGADVRWTVTPNEPPAAAATPAATPTAAATPPAADVPTTIGYEGFGGEFETGADGWRQVRSDFGIFKGKPQGWFYFNIRLRGSIFARKRAALVVHFIDARNYVEYEIDEAVLTRNEILNGRRIPGTPVLHGLGRPPDDVYTMAVHIEGQRLILSGARPGQDYKIISDTVDRRPEGGFGFAKDEAIHQFRFEGVVRE